MPVLATRPSAEPHISPDRSSSDGDGPNSTGPAGKPGGRASWRWKAAAALAAVLTTVAVWLVVGVVGPVYGAADNGDGPRLTCPAGLVLDTPSQYWDAQV